MKTPEKFVEWWRRNKHRALYQLQPDETYAAAIEASGLADLSNFYFNMQTGRTCKVEELLADKERLEAELARCNHDGQRLAQLLADEEAKSERLEARVQVLEAQLTAARNAAVSEALRKL